jgi:hypothetical protein
MSEGNLVNRVRDGAAFATLVMALAACGPAASGNSGEPSSATSPAASEASVGGASVSPGAVADLEAWIPDSVAGMTMQKQSMSGDVYAQQFGDPGIAAMLEDLAIAPADASVAIGVGNSPALNLSARMLVVRAPGADSDQLDEAFKTATNGQRTTPLEWTATSIGGKQVESALDPPATYYLYVKGDVLVFLIPSDQDVAAEIISGLP